MKATLVAKSTILFISVKKKDRITTVPNTTIKIQNQYNLSVFRLLELLIIFVVGDKTLGKASKHVSVVLNIVVKAAIAIIG